MNVEQERKEFLEEIQTNTRNTYVRAIFADWLDEHDEPELADFYRSWTLKKHEESEKWLQDYVDKIAAEGTEWDLDVKENYTLEAVLERANKHLDTGEPTIFLNFDTPVHIRSSRKKFWAHFQIVTGRRIGVKDYSEVFFRCGC